MTKKTPNIIFSLLFLWILCTNSAVSHAQLKKIFQFKKITQDTNYVRSYYHKLTITNFFVSRFYEISLTHPENTKSSNNYSSALPAGYALAIDYKWLALEYSFKLPFDERPTWQRTFRGGLTGKRFWIKGFWKEFRGMNKTEISFDDIFTENNTRFREDVYSQQAYFNVLYAFNKRKYSHLASLYMVDRQMKSAGSWAMGMAFMRNYTRGDSSIIRLNPKQESQDDITKIGAFSVFVQGGYAHTFIFAKKKLFFNVSLFPAFGLQRTKVKFVDRTTEKQATKVGFHNEAQISLGYNDKHIFTGIRVENLFFLDDLNSEGYHDYALTQTRIFFGIRL